MAKIEIFNDLQQVNLSSPVGRGGVNAKDDVLALQTLMKYALEDRAGWKDVRFPEPTGTMDGMTRALIKKYQRYMKRNLPTTVVDGRVDPAKGNSPYGKRGLWTILALNTDAVEIWLLKGAKNASFLHDIGLRFPAFKVAIGDNGVGTLNLPLDGGYEGVGTLGLELE